MNTNTIFDIKRKSIDVKKTGKHLEYLRLHNENIRRISCSVRNYYIRNDNSKDSFCKRAVDGHGDCQNCKLNIDQHISRKELSELFNVSESVIQDWESGRTRIGVEDLLYYSKLTGLAIDKILIFEE